MFAAILLLVVVAVVALLAVRLSAGPSRATGGATTVRAVFEEVLLFAAVVVSAVGASGLLGRALAGLVLDGPAVGGPVENARNSAFLVVGLPVVLVLGLRERRLLHPVPESPARVVYLALTSLTALVVAMTALHDSLVWAVGLQPENPRAVARAAVWSLVWLAHWRLDRTLTPNGLAVPHLLAGSAIGLATTAVGVVGVVGNTGDLLAGLRLDAFTAPQDQLRRAAVTLLVGGGAWAVYWWGRARTAHGVLPRSYQLLAALGGTVAAVVGTAWGLSALLLQLAGAPGKDAATTLRFLPHLVAVTLVGVAVRAYHGRLLGAGATVAGGRTDVHRLRDHGTGLVGLLTLGTGGVLAVVGTVGALTASVGPTGTAPRDLVLDAVAVLATGLAAWWLGHRGAAVAIAADGDAERASAVRRAYVLGVTGVGVLVGFGALVATVFLLFQDLFAGSVSLATVRSMRYPLGLLLVAAAVVAGHARTARAERSLHPRAVPATRFVLLVGPADAALSRAVSQAVGARVLAWPRTDAVEPAWPVADVVAAVTAADGPDVVVVRGPAGLLAVPVSRAGTPVVASAAEPTLPAQPTLPAMHAASAAK